MITTEDKKAATHNVNHRRRHGRCPFLCHGEITYDIALNKG